MPELQQSFINFAVPEYKSNSRGHSSAVSHLIHRQRLLSAKEGLPFVLAKFRLLVLLHKIATSTAATVTFSIAILLVRGKMHSPSTQTVLASVALDAISLAYVGSLHHLQNPLHSTVSETVPTTAVAVEEGPALQLRIFM